MKFPFGRRRVVAVGAVLIALSAGVVAYADIPDSNGVYHGCYLTKGNGALRIIDDSLKSCRPNETAISWNQVGASGASGPSGPADAFLAGSSAGVAPAEGDHVGVGGKSATDAVVAQVVPVAGTLSDLYVRVAAAPGSAAVQEFQLFVNGAASGIFCDVTDPAVACSDTTDTQALAAGDRVDLFVDGADDTANTPTLSAVTWSVRTS